MIQNCGKQPDRRWASVARQDAITLSTGVSAAAWSNVSLVYGATTPGNYAQSIESDAVAVGPSAGLGPYR